jgi:pimeloyl-ACP methyl ester carboxylesterase
MRNQTSADGTIGFDDVGRGPAVVLLHAFPLSRAMWRRQVDALQHAHRLIVPDLRGFGDSSGFPGTPSVDQLADDVAMVLDEVGVDRAVVGGLSMGGYVSLAFARRHPRRLRGLILANTRAEPDDEAARANRDRLIAQAAAGTGSSVIEGMLPRLLSPATLAERPAVAEEVRLIGAAQVSAGIVGALRALRDRPDARPSLAAIAVPTLVLVGRDDALTPVAASEVLASSIPGARLVILVGAGHLSNLEQPAAFNTAVRSFLDGLR